jgi:hypothetical protein
MVIKLVQRAVALLKTMMGRLTTAGDALGGSYMDNTSRVQFGVG